MKFSLIGQQGINLSDKFIIVDRYTNKTIERDKIINKRVNDIHFIILYNCNDDNTTNRTACEIEEKDKTSYFLNFVIRYQGFYFEPQSNIPIHRLSDNIFHSFGHIFDSDIKLQKNIQWTITRYEDNQGLWQIFDYFKEEEPEHLKETNIFIGGSYENYDTMIIDKNTIYSPRKNTKLLLMIETLDLNDFNTVLYNDYKRKAKSILDCYANIFSLWISLYNGFTFIFLKLYSKSFDKYKIIVTFYQDKKIIIPK